jgi:Zn-dependent protease with chaperone function
VAEARSSRLSELQQWVQARRDSTLRQSLLEDAGVRLAQQRLEEQTNGYGMYGRRRLLTGALRVQRGMVPKLERAFDACRERLGFTMPIELFVRADADIGAFMMASPTGPLALGVTSRTIEAFSDAELRHVVGHELGHAIFDHTSLPMPGTALVEDMAGAIVSRERQLELFLWCRAAEITTDRCGLLCAGAIEPACTAFMKLVSGLADASFGHFDVDAYVQQAGAIASAPVARLRPRTDDDTIEAFGTHPYPPMRLQAMRAYARSEGFHRFLNTTAPASSLSMAALEDEVESALELMEASYLEEKGDASAAMRKALLCGGYLVASATSNLDGMEAIAPRAKQALVALLGTDALWPIPTKATMTAALAERLAAAAQSPLVWRRQLVQHLVVIGMADGGLQPAERAMIIDVATKLSVATTLIEHTQRSAAAPFT